MRNLLLLAGVSGLLVTPAYSQTAPAAPVVAAPAPINIHHDPNVLPANTEVLLRMNEDLSGKSAEVGTTFYMTVAQDVIHNNMIVIPRGTRGMGEVTWETDKGAFGKSGKMEVEIKYIELGGRRIPVHGKFRQEGEGNTVATIATAVMVGVFSAFVTGKSALIPKGRELAVHTVDPLPFTSASAAPPTVATITPAVASPAQADPKD